MKYRLIFYIIYACVLVAILFISFVIYFGDVQNAFDFFSERKPNVFLIILLTLFLSNLFDLISFKRDVIEERVFLNEVLTISGKTIVIILIVSFIEFFLFFRTKLGRVVYVNYFFLLVVFLTSEHLIVKHVIGDKREKILWLSSIPYTMVSSDYDLPFSDSDISTTFYDSVKDYDVVIYDYPPKNHKNISELMHTIITIKNPIDLITYIEQKMEKIPLRYVEELWLLKNIRTYESVYDKLKRVMNVISSVFLLLILFPLSFTVAFAHRIHSTGPIFFTQERMGYLGCKFQIIKFRTMVDKAEKDGPRFAHENDERITKIGRFMRKFRIDEVPQLINILKGDMNLIGPRPEREEFIEALEKDISFYKLRLEIRPGLTGWAQVNFPYAGYVLNDHLKKLEYDLYYIKNRSIALDVVILFQTVKTMFTRGGT